MTDNHQPLRDALKAGPTMGPWRISSGCDRWIIREKGGAITCVDQDPREWPANAAYIAAANPAAISALLADLDAAVKDAERWRELLNHVGADRQCGRFGFTLYTLQPLRGTNPMQGAVCQHFTAAIDAALSQIKAGREQA